MRSTIKSPPPSLADEVRRALHKRKGKFPKVSAATGISHSWLYKFSDGKLLNPSYEYLRRLADLFATGTI